MATSYCLLVLLYSTLLIPDCSCHESVSLTEEDKINIKLAEDVNLDSVEITYPGGGKCTLRKEIKSKSSCRNVTVPVCRTVEKIRLQNITEDCSLQAEYCYTTYRTENTTKQTIVCTRSIEQECTEPTGSSLHCFENNIVECSTVPQTVAVTEKKQMCEPNNTLQTTKICFTYPDASWVCRENEDVKECDRDGVRLVGHEEIRPKIECKQRSGPPICIPTGCNLLDVEPECVSADLPDKLELKDELCEQCEEGRNKLRTVVVQEKVCLDKTQAVCNQIPSTVPSWFKYCNTPVLYTGSERTPDNDYEEDNFKSEAGSDLRPVDNKNIGGADVYFANQFLQQENIGDKQLGQIEVSETTLADPYITEYNLNPRFYKRPTPQPVTAAVSTTTAIKSTTLASGTALSHSAGNLSSSTKISLSDSITETSFSDVSSVTPSTVASSQSLGVTALPISETEEDLLDYGNSNSGINFLDQLLYDTGVVDNDNTPSSSSGSLTFSSEETTVSNMSKTSSNEDLTISTFKDNSASFKPSVENTNSVPKPISASTDSVLELSSASTESVPKPISPSTESVSKPISASTESVSKPISASTESVSKPISASTDSVSKPISASTDSVPKPISASTDSVLELSSANTEPFFEPVSTSTDPISDSNLEVPPENDIQELKNDILGEDDNNEGFEYGVPTGRNIIEASNLNNFEISNPNYEYLPFSNEFGIAYQNNEFGVINIDNDYETTSNENGVSDKNKIYEKNPKNKDDVLVNAANWKSYEHVCKSIENKVERARCRIITCFNNSTDCFFPK